MNIQSTGRDVDAFVIVATKGRPREVRELLDWLDEQTFQPRAVVIVAVEDDDLEDLETHRFAHDGRLRVLLTHVPGLCIQRNAGLDCLLNGSATGPDEFFVVFFDDDFRPACDWLERCRNVLMAQPEIAALTGKLLADGANHASVTPALARSYIEGKVGPVKHWASGEYQRELTSMYGCNMAYRGCVVKRCRFDENLPLYGWQEDQDFTSQAKAFGLTVYEPSCRGVHLGSRSGRVSGVRFGYSQIANPWYLVRKGTMSARKGTRFVLRHLAANSARTIFPSPRADYFGRLKGNLLAILDLMRGRCHPRRVADLR